MTFYAPTASYTLRRMVTTVKSPIPFDPVSKKTWTSFIQIPSIVSTSNGTCRIINVSYELQLTVSAGGCSIDTPVIIPIVIGTIPLADSNPTEFSTKNMSATYQNCTFGPNASNMPQEINRGEMIESDQASYVPLYLVFSSN